MGCCARGCALACCLMGVAAPDPGPGELKRLGAALVTALITKPSVPPRELERECDAEAGPPLLILRSGASRFSRNASCASCERVHHEPFPAADGGRGTLMKRCPLIERVDLMRFLTRASQSLPKALRKENGRKRMSARGATQCYTLESGQLTTPALLESACTSARTNLG